VSVPLASSTVITPSLPTFSKASVIKEPIASSLFAEIEATCLIFSDELPTVTEFLLSSQQLLQPLYQPLFSNPLD